jgi:zinc transport system substrate-binding protein
MVDTSAALGDRLLPLEESVTHQHGPTGAHSHAGLAFTIWLDPTLAILQARAVAKAFGRARPEHEAALRANLAALEADLRALDTRLEAAARAIGDTPLLFSHPVYPYLIRRYGLDARSLHWEPDEPPDARAWRELREVLAEHPARWMLWEAEPLPETARSLRELDIESRVFDPCANVPEEGDFLAIMARNAEVLESLGRELARE